MKVNVLHIQRAARTVLATAVVAAITPAARAHGLPEFFRSEFSDAVPVTDVNSPRTATA